MSDLNLLLFGCLVSFIALGGAYLYLRQSWAGAVERRIEASEDTKRALDRVA